MRVGLDHHFVMIAERLNDPLGGTLAVVDEENSSLPSVVPIHRKQLFAHARRERRDGPAAQFVDHHLEAGERAHARDQGDFIDGFGQEVVRPRLETTHPISRLVQCGHHHHRQMRRRRIGLEAATNFESVHARHHHVEQNDVARALLA